jgi:hypothetical protein
MTIKKRLGEIIRNPLSVYLTWSVFLSYPLFSFIRHHPSPLLPDRFQHPWSIFLHLPYISAPLFIVIVLFWTLTKINRELTRSQIISLYFVGISSVVTIVIGEYLLFLGSANYANYLYSRLGIETEKLSFMVSVSQLVFTFFLPFIYIEKKFRKRLPLKVKLVLFTLFLFIFSSLNFLTRVNYFWKTATAGPTMKYGWQFKYITALQETPIDAVIIHPPRDAKWPATGNQPVLRYFLFPRNLVDGKLISNESYAGQFNGALFVDIDPHDTEGVRWPIISTTLKEITFDDENPIAYSSLERISEIAGIAIYKVYFK